MAFAHSTDFIIDIFLFQFETVWYFERSADRWVLDTAQSAISSGECKPNLVSGSKIVIFPFAFFLSSFKWKNHHLAKFVLFYRHRSVSFHFLFFFHDFIHAHFLGLGFYGIAASTTWSYSHNCIKHLIICSANFETSLPMRPRATEREKWASKMKRKQ